MPRSPFLVPPLLALLTLGGLARAAEPPPEANAPVAAAPPAGTEPGPPPAAAWPALSPGRHLGAQLDIGFPGGIAAEVVFRPWWWFRASAGPAFNLMGWGLRAGVGFTPLEWGVVTPSLNLDYGHFFSGDLTHWVTPSSAAEEAVLKDAPYDWLAASIGLEFGSRQGFAFYVRGGLTWLWSHVPGADATALAQDKAAGTNTTITTGDVSVSGLLPYVSLGFILYFL
jgi:hypothetical protein